MRLVDGDCHLQCRKEASGIVPPIKRGTLAKRCRSVSTLRVRMTRSFIAVGLLIAAVSVPVYPAEDVKVRDTTLASSPSMSDAPRLTGDDAVKVRNALVGKVGDDQSSTIEQRTEGRVIEALPPTLRSRVLRDGALGREVTFVLPVSRGIRYQSKTHVATVRVDLADSDRPGAIILKNTVTGRRGWHLVVAAEARSKGYIEHIDMIVLDPVGSRHKTTVRGTFSSGDANSIDGNLAIMLTCRLVPPYLTESTSHTDPSDDEPTDITTRISILHGEIDSLQLVNLDRGVVLTQRLHLAN